MTKEQKFYRTLEDLFVEAKIEVAATPNPAIATVQKNLPRSR